MKTLLAVGLMAPIAALALRGVSVYALRDPNFGEELLVVVERSGKDAKAIWDAEDENLEEVRTDAGEVLEPSPFTMTFAGPGAADPTHKGFGEVEAGRSLLVFEFRPPAEKVKSIPRFAGTYELLHGGEERWIDVPFKKVAAAKAWKDEAFDGSGFELQQGVREVQVIQVRLSGEVFEVDDVAVLAQGADKPLDAAGSAGDFDAIEYSFDLPGKEPDELGTRIRLDDGSVIEIDGIPRKAKYAKVENKQLAKAKLVMEVRQAPVLEAFLEGKANFDLLRGYRWVGKKGKKLEIWPRSTSSGGERGITSSCRVPSELPRGARMQLGVLVGAAWETISFEYKVKVKD